MTLPKTQILRVPSDTRSMTLPRSKERGGDYHGRVPVAT